MQTVGLRGAPEADDDADEEQYQRDDTWSGRHVEDCRTKVLGLRTG
jgi:hypothetical protein